MTDEERNRPEGQVRAASRVMTATDASIADCGLCERRPRAHGWEWCHRCLRDTVAGLRRRRNASYRLEPLESGLRDPLGGVA